MAGAGQGGEFRYRAVERRILDMIESGRLVPGGRAPSLRAMSRAAGVSLATVGHAYEELERRGVLLSRPRSGYFLREGRAQLSAPARPSASPQEPRPVNRQALIRMVLTVVGDRDLVPFGVAGPEERLLHEAHLTRVLARVLRDDPLAALNYTPVHGLTALRRQIAFRAQEWGAEVRPEDVLVTSGAIEALHIALRALTRPGDAVLVQSPTYHCFLQLLENLGLRVIEAPSSPTTGISPAQVREAVDRFDLRCCILTPNFNNPDGALLPEEAKAEIVDILAERDIPLVEDDVYGDLHFGPTRPTGFKKWDRRGLVLQCSSFSKTLCPGWRVGWIIPGRFLERALDVKFSSSVATATPTQMAVAQYLAEGRYDRHLRRLRSALEAQTRTIRHLLSRYFPAGTRVTRPLGGCVLWLELPGGVDSVDLFYRARAEGVGIAPGNVFSTQDRFSHCIRLNAGALIDERADAGLRLLGRLAAQCAGGRS
ncbi:aminotransferase class I/II-fold pyridoxal phosphate-dependent enzyme [Desulfovibrio aminophilus]|uniref:aminotransferase-like domain-containing protein n=1 Tax=Desulfovibrio aminophilus TaxID=81425 RepID=UPI0033971180